MRVGVTTYSNLPVTILKEYAYCPRIAYYKLYSVSEPPTESMIYGKIVASKDRLKEILEKAGLKGDVLLDVKVSSRRLGVTGIVDAVIINGTRAKIIEVKNQR